MEGQINFEENLLEDVAMGWSREERRSAGCLEEGDGVGRYERAKVSRDMGLPGELL